MQLLLCDAVIIVAVAVLVLVLILTTIIIITVQCGTLDASRRVDGMPLARDILHSLQ